MFYTNITKQNSHVVYPLPTPVIGVDQKFDLWSTDQCSSEAGLSSVEILRKPWWSTKNTYKHVVGGGEGQYPTHRCDQFHRHQEGSALLTGRTVDAPPSGKSEGIVLKV